MMALACSCDATAMEELNAPALIGPNLDEIDESKASFAGMLEVELITQDCAQFDMEHCLQGR
jgi:hypothetical protein